jgi:hypothetical protein
MTRIGRCQIKTRHLAGNASYRRDKLAPLKNSLNQTASTLTPPGPQAFLRKSHSRVQRIAAMEGVVLRARCLPHLKRRSQHHVTGSDVPQPTEWQRIGNQIDAAFIFARQVRCGVIFAGPNTKGCYPSTP